MIKELKHIFMSKDSVESSMTHETPKTSNDYIFSNNKIKSTDNFKRFEAKTLLEIKHLIKEFNGEQVLKGIDLVVKENEFVTFLGPSGCGKTTTLRIIAGFDHPTSGDVIFNGESILPYPPYERQINTVFQKYALFPHMDVFNNIAFGLRMKRRNDSKSFFKFDFRDKKSEKVIKEKVLKMLKLVKLDGFANRSVDSLSGGQQQRVAIARALVNEPKLLLLDEPLGALDLKLRQEMQYELKEMQRKLGITFIFVTHDQEEALTMSDTIVVMKDGIIQQIGTPVEVYNEPVNKYVANFIGESNIFVGHTEVNSKVTFQGATFEHFVKGFEPFETVDVVIRPEDFLIMNAESAPIKGVVDSCIFKGVHYEICVMVGETEYVIHSTDKAIIGNMIGITVDAEDIHIMKMEQVKVDAE